LGVLKPASVICLNVECVLFYLFWRIIHYVCVGKTFGDIDAVKRRCMDHVLVNSDYVTICGERSELFT